jgi:aminopeptidase N
VTVSAARPGAPTGRPPSPSTVASSGDGLDPNGIGDALIPGSGDPGYDVQHYDLLLSYDPVTHVLLGHATITAVATTNLARFTLDLSGFSVDSVRVGGKPARVTRQGGELGVVPPMSVHSHTSFITVVVWHGVPKARLDPNLGFQIGWIPTVHGSYVANEPDGASTWFPANDHPSDKATYRISVSVPDTYSVAVSGRLVASKRRAGKAVTTWEMPQPMATYLVEVAIGAFKRVDGVSATGVPIHAYTTATAGDVRPAVGLVGHILDRFRLWFGPYPFAESGFIATETPAGIALETQSRPLVSSRDVAGPVTARQQAILSHELAHQWFGDAVTPARWADIWLSEGFATYAAWLWLDQQGVTPLAQSAASALARTHQLRLAYGPPDRPHAATLFSPSVYEGGAVVLQALRQTVGDARFFAILRKWVATYHGRSVTTSQFIDLASTVVGDDLSRFFSTWLTGLDVPRRYPRQSSS